MNPLIIVKAREIRLWLTAISTAGLSLAALKREKLLPHIGKRKRHRRPHNTSKES